MSSFIWIATCASGLATAGSYSLRPNWSLPYWICEHCFCIFPIDATTSAVDDAIVTIVSAASMRSR